MAGSATTSWHEGIAELAAGTSIQGEELCDYIDQSLTEHGDDVVALTARHVLGRYQFTNNRRKW